jgi:hypothetical protein
MGPNTYNPKEDPMSHDIQALIQQLQSGSTQPTGNRGVDLIIQFNEMMGALEKSPHIDCLQKFRIRREVEEKFISHLRLGG